MIPKTAMRNVIDEGPDAQQHGRTAFSRSFVDPADLDQRQILDVGCGFGGFVWFALASGARSVTGIEPTERDLATVRRTITDPRASFEVGGAPVLPFASGSFDTVFMWEVLEHIPAGTEAATFGDIARVLRRGGRLYLSTPHASPVSRLTDPAWWLVHHRHYSLSQAEQFAVGAGFEIERAELHGGWWEIIYMLDLYASKWLLRRPPLLAAGIQPRLDRDWSQRPGFTNVFLRCLKP